MEPRKIFLVLFILSILSFFPLMYFARDSYLYEAPVHIGFFSFAMFFLWKKDLRTTLDSLGIPGNLKKNILYTVGGFITISISLVILSIMLNYAGLNDQQNINDIIKGLPLYLLAMAVIFAPFSEELLFRALFINKLKKYTKSAAIAVLVSALIFASLHLTYNSVVELAGAFVIGAILGAVYVKSESIIPPIAIHMVFNLVSITLMLWFG